MLKKKSIGIIGSGPFHIAKGIFYLKNGFSVDIFDENSFSGGAWALRPMFSKKEKHDAFAHLLSPFPDSYELLNNCNFKMRPRPIFFIIHKPTSNMINDKNLLSDKYFKPIVSKHSFLLGWHQYYAIQGKDDLSKKNILSEQTKTFLGFQYFEKNMGPLIEFLTTKFHELGGKIKLNKLIDRINVNDQKVIIHSFSEKFCFEACHIGRHLTADIYIKEKLVEKNLKENLYSSLLVKISCTEITAEYINFEGHPQIGAVQFERIEKLSNGKYLFVACFIASLPSNPDLNECSKNFIDYLTCAGVLKDVVILETEFFTLTSYSRDKESLDKIYASSKKRIVPVVVDSLMQNMSEEKNIWNEALKLEN